MTVDVSRLSTTRFLIPLLYGARCHAAPAARGPGAARHDIRVLPTSFLHMQFTFNADFNWGVDFRDGTITYHPAYERYLSGAGTSTLTVDGYPVEIDATALGAGTFVLFGMFPYDLEPVVDPDGSAGADVFYDSSTGRSDSLDPSRGRHDHLRSRARRLRVRARHQPADRAVQSGHSAR